MVMVEHVSGGGGGGKGGAEEIKQTTEKQDPTEKM